MPPAWTDRFSGAPLDAVKLAAAGLMVIDHVNTVLLDGAATWMWRLGRIAFPLFAFALALNLVRGADAGRYVLTLCVAAIPTQLAYTTAFSYGTKEASILVTLTLGAALAALLLRSPPLVRHGALIGGLLAVFLATSQARTGVDFGLAGVLLPAALALAIRDPWPFGLHALVALFAVNYGSWRPAGEAPLAATARDWGFILLGGALVLGASLAWQGRARFLPPYALLLFYPAHLATLAGLRWWMAG